MKQLENKSLQHIDIKQARSIYSEGKNVIDFLRTEKRLNTNTSEIIELAYDLQAGSYIQYVTDHYDKVSLYIEEIARILDPHVSSNTKILDIGTGELTTLSLLIKALTIKPQQVYAFDISWSRVYKGLYFAQKQLGVNFDKIVPFIADMSEIPLLDKSINITISSHALEPNGDKLADLLTELFRVTIDKLILFEPCYEINSPEGQSRMRHLGYIRNMEGIVKQLGGELLETIKIKHISNPLNPTACFIITPPENNISAQNTQSNIFSVPGTNIALKKVEQFYYSHDVGLCYPILKNIPVLKSNSRILATSLGE